MSVDNICGSFLLFAPRCVFAAVLACFLFGRLVARCRCRAEIAAPPVNHTGQRHPTRLLASQLDQGTVVDGRLPDQPNSAAASERRAVPRRFLLSQPGASGVCASDRASKRPPASATMEVRRASPATAGVRRWRALRQRTLCFEHEIGNSRRLLMVCE